MTFLNKMLPLGLRKPALPSLFSPKSSTQRIRLLLTCHMQLTTRRRGSGFFKKTPPWKSSLFTLGKLDGPRPTRFRASFFLRLRAFVVEHPLRDFRGGRGSILYSSYELFRVLRVIKVV